MVVIIPDEDLYEQGIFPSRWNQDHKWTFTPWKKESWSSKSVNVIEFCDFLPGSKFVHLIKADSGYDYSLRNVDQTLDGNGAESFIELVLQKR